MAASSHSLFDMEGLLGAPSSTFPPVSQMQKTSFSLLDMDLCDMSVIADSQKNPENANPQNKQNDGENSVTITPSKMDPECNKHLEEILQQQRQHQDELKEIMEQMVGKILTNMETAHTEQKKEIANHVNTQLEYFRTQFNAAVGWRIQNHHTDMLKEIHSVLTPLSDLLTHLEGEVKFCKESITTMTEEITTARMTTSLSHVGVQSQQGKQWWKSIKGIVLDYSSPYSLM